MIKNDETNERRNDDECKRKGNEVDRKGETEKKRKRFLVSHCLIAGPFFIRCSFLLALSLLSTFFLHFFL